MQELGVIKNGAVLIVQGRIAQVGSERSVCRAHAARAIRHLDAGRSVVLPGFVDSHTHALFAGPRLDEYVARIAGASYEEIARAGGGIQASARRIQAATEAALVAHLDMVMRRFLEYGTTTAEVKSGYGLDPIQELKMLRVIGKAAVRPFFDLVPTLLFHDIPSRYKNNRPRFIKQVTARLIPEVARRQLAEFCDVFCDRGYFSVAESRTLLNSASRAGFKLKMHAEQLSHSGAALMATRLGAVSVDHLDRLTETDVRRLRGTRTIATLLPGTALHLGSTVYPPARRLIEERVPVALASNFNPGSSPTMNMQLILSLACASMRMTPAEAIVASTTNGAWAVGRGDRLGSLEVGKQADLVVMEVSDYREVPYYFGLNHCGAVIKKGRMVYSKGTA